MTGDDVAQGFFQLGLEKSRDEKRMASLGLMHSNFKLELG